MKWSEITYIDHGMECLVRYDTPEHPSVMDQWRGFVDCSPPGAMAFLALADERAMHLGPTHATARALVSPPPYAHVYWIVP